MTLLLYTTKVREERLLELPEEAQQLHLKPGQEIQIQLNQTLEQLKDPTLALFDQWESEDAARTPEQYVAAERLWLEFEAGLDANRQAQGMRLI